MVDYVKSGTGTNLAAAAGWTAGSGFPSSVTADTATWSAASPLSLGGTLSGNISTRKVTVNEASANITHTGTLTLGTDGFLFASTNGKSWAQTGSIAVGANNQTWTLCNTTTGSTIQLTGSTSLTSSTSSVTVIFANGSGVNNNDRAYIVATGACAGFTGTIQLNDYTAIASNSASNLTGANFIINGVGCQLYPAASGQSFGAAGKTLTINQDTTLGFSGRFFTIAPNAVLAGTGTRTLTVAFSTTMSGTVTGSNGITATMQNSTGRAGGSGTTYLLLTGTSSGLSGPCVVSGGRFIIGPSTTAARYVPTSIDVASSGVFEYYPMSNTDFTFPCAPTGTGFITLFGNYSSGGGVTFSAGQLTSFGGIVRCEPAPDATYQAARVRLFELPSGLDWFAVPNSSGSMTGEFTYLGSAATYATNLTIDNYNNTSLSGLRDGIYSLIVPNTSGAINITGTVQRLNTAATASDRMSLRLGGSNTGDNTLSGTISEIGTNSAILGITKIDAGRWVLSGTNTYTGINTISGGTLSAQSAAALGSATSTGGVTISSTGVLELSGGITLNKSVTDFTVTNTSSPIQSVGGSNTLSCKALSFASSATTTLNIDSGNTLTLANNGGGVISGSSAALTKSGEGTLLLPASANTFSGLVTVSAGVLSVGSVANSGSAAAWGQGTQVDVTGTLQYLGAEGSSSRIVRLVGATPSLDASGTAGSKLTLSNVTQDTTTKTLTLKGTNASDNTISNALANNTGVLSVSKEGTGRWLATGALSYTGTTQVSAGTLRVQTSNSNATTGAATVNPGGTVELVTDTLASSAAGAGRVLGSSAVTCNGGTITTRGGTTQKGMVRYGGNLTFGAGSTLNIGQAA